MKVEKWSYVILLSILTMRVLGQGGTDKAKIPLKDRLVYGGNFGLQLGNPTLIDISPTVGYKVSERFMPGLGITYIYYGVNVGGDRYSTSVYGGRLFGRMNLAKQIFAQTEFEMLSFQDYDDSRKWVPAWLVGAGYNQPIGDRSSLYVMAMWNVLERMGRPSLYNNPIIRVGINL